MKNLFKKVAIALTLVMAFGLCFAFVGCGCEHNWVEKSNTSTCTQSGEITYECSKCKNTKTEKAEIKDHEFVGTKCKVCNLTVTSTWSPKSNCTKCSNTNIIGDNKSYYTKLSTTATSTTDGVAYYLCPKCHKKFFVLEKAFGN